MIFIFFLLFLISKTPALAVQEFNLDQEINYQINSVGDATVNQTLTLTNNYDHKYLIFIVSSTWLFPVQ